MEAFKQATLLAGLVREVDLPEIIQARVTSGELFVELFYGELHICY